MSPATTAPVARSLRDLRGGVLQGVRPLGGAPADVAFADGHLVSSTPVGQARHDLPIHDARDLILLPGLVDLHTHLREPGAEDAETIASGTRSAAAGGYTDVFAMANTSPVTDSVSHLAAMRSIIDTTAACRVHPVGAITYGLHGRELAPIAEMAAHGVRMFSDDGTCVDNASLMREALALAARHGVLLAQHAQHGQLAGDGQINAGPAAQTTGLPPWPAVAEATIVARDALLAAEAGAPLHVCHVSTQETVEVVRWAKAQGWPVTAEVTPHHLLLTDELAALLDPRYKVNPPLRRPSDVHSLREALLDGTLDLVGTDHAPHTTERKHQPWCSAPFGMTGLETALPVVAHVLDVMGALDWSRLAELMSVTPARVAGIDTTAGRPLHPGEPATFCLVDPTASAVVTADQHYSQAANTPFQNQVLHHQVLATVIEGHLTHTTATFEQRTGRNEP